MILRPAKRERPSLGGKIAYQYATTRNIDAVTLEGREAILADPNRNLIAHSIAGIDV